MLRASGSQYFNSLLKSDNSMYLHRLKNNCIFASSNKKDENYGNS